MSQKNYYEILGVSKSSSADEIKKAYRKLSLKWHPDRWVGKSDSEKKQAEEKMKELNYAYKILSDSEKRSNYDRFGNEDYSFRRGGGNSGGGFQGDDSFFKDVFDSFFGESGFSSSKRSSSKNESVPKDGQDVLINVEVNFKESIVGTKKTIILKLDRACSTCKQTGAYSQSDIITCSNCQGRGVVNVIQRTILGVIRTQGACDACQGQGKIIRKKCSDCNGNKFLSKREEIQLNIPKGINPEKKLRYQGKGNDGINGGSRGDVYVIVKVKDNPYFTRRGNDIYVNLEISFLDAILGNKVEIITIEGLEKVQIEPGSQNGDSLILKNKGCYTGVNKETRGNLIALIKIKIPKKISPVTEKSLKLLQAESSWNPNKDFIGKYKDFLNK